MSGIVEYVIGCVDRVNEECVIGGIYTVGDRVCWCVDRVC